MDIRRATIEDADAVRAIYCHPEMAAMFFDGSIGPEQIEWRKVLRNTAAYYIIVSQNGEDLGLFLFYPMNLVTFELHVSFLPCHRGGIVREAALLAKEYMFTETPCRKVVAYVPAYNRSARVMAHMCGMKQEGINRKSFLKDGDLTDQYAMGFCKEVA